MASAVHLTRRFFGSLRPGGPRRTEAAWAESQLLPGEVRLWRKMRGADRRHAVAVARRVEASLGDRAERPVLAAALLHDVGKLDSKLGTYGRVIATLSGMVVRHDDDVLRAWTKAGGFTRRVGLYLQHPRLGGDMLALAGSDDLTVAWAREHHLPREERSVPRELGDALEAADDD